MQMQVVFTFTDMAHAALFANSLEPVLSKLAGMAPGKVFEPASIPAAQPSASPQASADAPREAVQSEAGITEDKPKRGRPRKLADSIPEVPSHTYTPRVVTAEPAPVPAAPPMPPAPAKTPPHVEAPALNTAPTMTLKQFQSVFIAAQPGIEKNYPGGSKKAMTDILAKLGADRFSLVRSDQYPAAIELLNAAAAPQTA